MAERIDGELADLRKTVDRVARAWHEAKHHQYEQDLFLDSAALNLHAFYSGLEGLFEHIAKTVDHSLPAGQSWHRQLLKQMADENALSRPAVISSDVAQRLDEYRRFRHLIRNVYAINLLPDRIQVLVDDLPELWTKIQDELLRFFSISARCWYGRYWRFGKACVGRRLGYFALSC